MTPEAEALARRRLVADLDRLLAGASLTHVPETTIPAATGVNVSWPRPAAATHEPGNYYRQADDGSWEFVGPDGDVWGVRPDRPVTAQARVIERPAEGLAVVEYVGGLGYGTDLWVRRTLRKLKRCAVTDRAMPKGSLAYGPVGNQAYRGERIDAAVIESASEG